MRDVTIRRCAIGLVALFATAGLASCDQKSVLLKLSQPEDRALAERVVSSLQACDVPAVSQLVAAPLRAGLEPILPRMCAATPKREGATVRLVGASTTSVTGTAKFRQANLAYAIDRGAEHALVRVGVRHEEGTVAITDLYVTPLKVPADQLTRFDLVGKSPVQYLFLALTIMAFTVSVTALISVIRTKGIKRKWLWALGSVIGLGQFAVDWSSGAVRFQPLSIQFFSAFAVTSGVGPWTVGFALPVFAVLFLLRRKALREFKTPRSPLNL